VSLGYQASPSGVLSFSYWIDYLGFITEGKLAAILIKPSLGVSNWPVILLHQQTQSSFLASSSPRHQSRLRRGRVFGRGIQRDQCRHGSSGDADIQVGSFHLPADLQAYS
jgi:hypothetical protein